MLAFLYVILVLQKLTEAEKRHGELTKEGKDDDNRDDLAWDNQQKAALSVLIEWNGMVSFWRLFSV